ncbi:MAG: ATP-binding protein [Nanoarchaeota archaeon]|nr:ATP-binding protein [Nanoarchaeota archaeon]
MKKRQFTAHFIILNLMRFILILTFIYSLVSNSPLIQIISLIALAVTFIPWLLKELFGLEIPSMVEIIYILFIYGLLVTGETKGFFQGLWGLDILMTLTASVTLGFVGLSIIHILYKRKRINANPAFAALVIFTFTVAMGSLWELFEFTLDALLNTSLQKGLIDTMQDLAVNILGGLLVAIHGFHYIKTGKSPLVSLFISKKIEENLWLLGPRKITDPKIKILDLIDTGENYQIEFKSTFRTNLHTKEFDKRMELGILKTLSAFLNTRGGNLLVGVDNDGNLLGLKQDNFESDDKLSLHVTNLIKSHIGNEFVPFIKFELVQIKDKKILLMTVTESKKQVFLKIDGVEEFYIRNGPSSVKLAGNSLVDYIKYKFE